MSEPLASARPSKAELIVMALVLLSVALSTSHRFRNGFVWDDYYTIENGEVLHDLRRAPFQVFAHPTVFVTNFYDAREQRPVDTYRPVTLLTFMVDSALSGHTPRAYHATNLIGHLICVLLVFLLARRMLPTHRAKYAPFAAAWFGLSPHLAEAHVWINGRSDVFCTLFGLGALLAWRSASAPERRVGARVAILASSGALFLLAALSKEVVLLVWPALLLWPRSDGAVEPNGLGPAPGQRWAHVGSLIPFAAASGIYVVMRFIAIDGVRATGRPGQLAIAIARLPALLLEGAVQSIVPTRVYVHSMMDDYANLGPYALGGLAILVLAASIVLAIRRRRVALLTWSWIWFTSTLAPAAMIATMLWPGFGRYLYLPMAGLVIGLTDVLARILEVRPRAVRIVRILSVLYLLVLAGRLAVYTLDFESDDALWGSVIRQDPDAHHGHGYLGIMRTERRRYTEAIAPLRRAVNIAPEHPRYLETLGSSYFYLGDCDSTLEIADMGIRLYSPLAGSYHMLAVNCLNGRDPEGTLRHLLRCLADEPAREDCPAALAHSTSEHRLAVEYRRALSDLLESDEFSALRPRVEELMEPQRPSAPGP